MRGDNLPAFSSRFLKLYFFSLSEQASSSRAFGSRSLLGLRYDSEPSLRHGVETTMREGQARTSAVPELGTRGVF